MNTTNSKYNKDYGAIRKAKGLCRNCSNKVPEGKTYCRVCLDKKSVYTLARQANLTNLGKCRLCGVGDTLPNTTKCESCKLRSAASRHTGSKNNGEALKSKIIGQNYKCALSGLDLQIGIDAELDHIIPKSRGGEDVLDNLQWLHKKVNQMKSNMLEEELYYMCKTIVNNLQEKYEAPN